MIEIQMPDYWSNYKNFIRVPRMKILRDLWEIYGKLLPYDRQYFFGDDRYTPGTRKVFKWSTYFFGWGEQNFWMDSSLQKYLDASNTYGWFPQESDYLTAAQRMTTRQMTPRIFFYGCAMRDYYKILRCSVEQPNATTITCRNDNLTVDGVYQVYVRTATASFDRQMQVSGGSFTITVPAGQTNIRAGIRYRI